MANKKTKSRSHKSHLKLQASPLINDCTVLALEAPSLSCYVPSKSNSPHNVAGTSTAKVIDWSSVEHHNTSSDGSLEADCYEDGEFEEEQLDFSCSEEDYATSPPPSSPAPVVLEPPASPKSATSTPSRSVKTGNPSVPPTC